MATKWKNTIKKTFDAAKKNKDLCISIIMMILGLAGIVVIDNAGFDYYGMTTGWTWIWGVGINIFFGIGVWHITGFCLRRSYGTWIPTDEGFYKEWTKKWSKQQRWLISICLCGMVIAWLFFYDRRFAFFNYAYGYVLVTTVLVQSILVEYRILKFMRGRLDMLMDRMSEINRQNLAEAVELEKKSIIQAAKSEQLKVDLISNVSHDLKTPLTSMVGYIELLKKEELDQVSKDYVEVISDKAEKLKEMIESLFSLAKASSGNIKLVPEKLHLNMLIEQIFADMEDRIAASTLQFVPMLTNEDTLMVSDNIHLYRICQNLIENALKYSAPGTRVFVKTAVLMKEEKPWVSLEVTNTASYMMDFTKEDIVERFARGDKSRSTDGNGLGLAIVSTYAGALGGTFDINIDCDQFKAILTFPKGDLENTSQLQ